MRAAITLAGGREVCFVATIDEEGNLATARVVARGDVSSVLSLPGCACRGEMLVHNHPSGVLEPSEADSEIAHRLHLDGVGFAIINNAANDIYVVVEVPQEPVRTLLDPEAVAHELSTDGKIGRCLREHEDRASQRDLARQIARLYNREGIGVLEAGTGVGKSLAYLVPALRWAAGNRDRTVVSTNTINLQEQIISNDLPLLTRALSDQQVRFTLLKGWRNYVCLQRLENAHTDQLTLFDADGIRGVRALRKWAESTDNGSLSDLPAQPSSDVWDEVVAEPDLCTRQRCKYFEKCFVFKARRAAAQSDVIVVNHHLLMADLSVRRLQQNWSEAAVLPAYNRLIIDEGHHLEDAAGKHLGISVSRAAFSRLLSRLERRGRGLLAGLRDGLSQPRNIVEAASHDLVDRRLIPAVESARRLSTEVFDSLGSVLRTAGVTQLRITGEFARHEVWRDGLERALDDLNRELTLLSDSLDKIRERLTSESSGEEDLPFIAEIRAVARRLETAGDALNTTLRPRAGAEPAVRWLETRGREGNVVASTVPLDLSSVLRDDLFKRVKTAIVTSATLSTNGSFQFTLDRLGLGDEAGGLDISSRSFPSAFHFEDQALLAVPIDFPLPNLEPEKHLEAVVDATTSLAQMSDGGIFVLCTSHRDVRGLASALRASDFAGNWPLLIHGENEPRDILLRRFRDSGRAVLLGTTSFWEGVDVRGEALRGIIIMRLPFKVPTEPMTAAHCEAIAEQGRDPFQQYLLPHAALRLKQGFGRLIRSSTDWGSVIITDPRVVVKEYGEFLLDSLPPAQRVIGPWQNVRGSLEKFYRQRRGS